MSSDEEDAVAVVGNLLPPQHDDPQLPMLRGWGGPKAAISLCCVSPYEAVEIQDVTWYVGIMWLCNHWS